MNRHIPIPEGLKELLQGFTVEVLRNQPRDICDFALQYFAEQKMQRKEKGQLLKSTQEAMQSDSEDDDEEFVGSLH